MESPTNIITMLQMMDRPAFCVSDGIIIDANPAARNRLLPIGLPVEPLLLTGHEEYAAFSEGWLYLTLQISGTNYGATIHRIDQFHIFTMEPGTVRSELQALALAAQQLRAPLSNIMTATERLFPDLMQESESPVLDQMARINKSINQMMRIIFNMSDASRYSSTPPRMETQDVDAVLREVFEQAAVLCEQAGVQLEYSGLVSPAYSLIDSEQLERSIYNILSNSLKATSKGGWIRAKLTRRGNTLYLTVQDSGSGLNKPVRGNPFDLYLREPSISDGSGLGLGLTLIRACATSHGGTVLWDPIGSSSPRLTLSLPIRLDSGNLRSPARSIDYAGERNHSLIELSDSLPPELYKPHKHS